MCLQVQEMNYLQKVINTNNYNCNKIQIGV